MVIERMVRYWRIADRREWPLLTRSGHRTAGYLWDTAPAVINSVLETEWPEGINFSISQSVAN